MSSRYVAEPTSRPRVARRRLLAGAGAASTALWLAACGGQQPAGGGSGPAGGAPAAGVVAGGTAVAGEQAKPGGTLKVAVSWDIDSLDPLTTKKFTTWNIAAFTYSRLVKFKTGVGQFSDGSIEGDIASRWEQPDETTVIMKVRDGMKLDPRAPTNGRALTAEDVVLSWERFAADAVFKGDLSNAANKDAPITSLRATDASTIEIKTAFPDAILLPVLGFGYNFWIVPKEGLTGGFDPKTEARGSGPWLLERYQPSVGFNFKKNPNWYEAPARPLADGIDLPIIVDAAQAVAQFKARNVFAEAVAPTDILATHKEAKDTRITLTAPGTGSHQVGFSWRPNSPFHDVRVRRALSMLIDRDTMLETFNDIKSYQTAGINMKGYWSIPYGAGNGPFWLDPKDPKFGPHAANLKYNVEEAKNLLTAAGYPNGIEFPISFITSGEYGREWGQRNEAIMAMWAKGGVRARANVVDYTSVFAPQILRSKGNFDGVATFSNGGRSDPGLFLAVFLSSSGANNLVGTTFPELDQLVLKQRRELDRQKRIAQFHDIQRYCAEHMPLIPQGGHTETPALSWNGLRGPEQYFQWAGNVSSSGAELYPFYWLDDSLRR
jgi:peptide/nickel transport system substrate-binding protein